MGFSVNIYPSKIRILIVFLMMNLASLSVFFIGLKLVSDVWSLSLMCACLMQIGLAIYGWYSYRREAIHQLDVSDDGELILRILRLNSSANVSYWVEVGSKSIFWSFLISLELRGDAGFRKQILILPDSVSTIGFRRLQVYLNWLDQTKRPVILQVEEGRVGNF